MKGVDEPADIVDALSDTHDEREETMDRTPISQWVEDQNDDLVIQTDVSNAIAIWRPHGEGYAYLSHARTVDGVVEERYVMLTREQWADIVRTAIERFGFAVNVEQVTTTVVTVT